MPFVIIECFSDRRINRTEVIRIPLEHIVHIDPYPVTLTDTGKPIHILRTPDRSGAGNPNAHSVMAVDEGNPDNLVHYYMPQSVPDIEVSAPGLIALIEDQTRARLHARGANDLTNHSLERSNRVLTTAGSTSGVGTLTNHDLGSSRVQTASSKFPVLEL